MLVCATGITALFSAAPFRNQAEALLWPVILAHAALGWLLVPTLPFVDPGLMTSVIDLMGSGRPARLATLAGLVPIFVIWRARSIERATPGVGGRAALSPQQLVMCAVVLTAVTLTMDFMDGYVGFQRSIGTVLLTTLVIVCATSLRAGRS